MPHTNNKTTLTYSSSSLSSSSFSASTQTITSSPNQNSEHSSLLPSDFNIRNKSFPKLSNIGEEFEYSNFTLYKSNKKNSLSQSIDFLTVYMLGRFLEREFKERFNISNPKFEQNFIESIQNIITYINLKLIDSNDIAVEYGEIIKVNKTIIKDGVFVYDIDKYPISYKKIRRNSLSNKEKTNLKLKRILSRRYLIK